MHGSPKSLVIICSAQGLGFVKVQYVSGLEVRPTFPHIPSFRYYPPLLLAGPFEKSMDEDFRVEH